MAQTKQVMSKQLTPTSKRLTVLGERIGLYSPLARRVQDPAVQT
jgi:hypothetical protein